MVHDNGLESVSRQFRTSAGDIGSSLITRQSRLKPHVDKEEWLLAPLEVSCAEEDNDEPMPPRLHNRPQRCIEKCGTQWQGRKKPRRSMSLLCVNFKVLGNRFWTIDGTQLKSPWRLGDCNSTQVWKVGWPSTLIPPGLVWALKV